MISISNMGIIALLLLFISALPSSADDELKYGSKVLWQDVDEARPLVALPPSTFNYVNDGVPGFGPGDPVYLHFPPPLLVNGNDIRLTPFGSIPAGTQVKIGDPDFGNTLLPLPATVVYFDVNGDVLYSLGDPVYLDVLPFGSISAGDIRITGYLGYEAGSRVMDAQADNGKPTLAFPGDFRFFNVNGNLAPGSFAVYDYGDLVYIDTQWPFFVVTINDVRLTS